MSHLQEEFGEGVMGNMKLKIVLACAQRNGGATFFTYFSSLNIVALTDFFFCINLPTSCYKLYVQI